MSLIHELMYLLVWYLKMETFLLNLYPIPMLPGMRNVGSFSIRNIRPNCGRHCTRSPGHVPNRQNARPFTTIASFHEEILEEMKRKR